MNDRPRLKLSRLFQEAIAGIAQRPSRSILTILGATLGVGSFIAVLGVTSTANGQIGRDFDAQLNTQVSVQVADNAAPDPLTGRVLPDDADSLAVRIDGVRFAGTSWDVQNVRVQAQPPGWGNDGEDIRVLAASPGYWNVVSPTMKAGRDFDVSLEDLPVAVIGAQVAESLHLADLDGQPVIFINDQPFSVIGVVATTEQSSSPLSAIVIPSAYARNKFGEPGSAATLSVTTMVGASQVVSEQLAVALDPVHPDNFKVVAPDNQQVVRDQVSTSIQALFIALALICMLVGAVGITNSTLIGVMSRTSEIGLRRSFGALPRHIAAQFLIESGVLGLMGGILGAWAGLITVVIVAIGQQWTAVIQPWSIFLAPAVGAAVGLLAGLYPAIRASRIEPVEAFRR